MLSQALDGSEHIPPLPSRLVTDEDLKQFYEVMKISDVPKDDAASNGVKRKSRHAGELDTHQYGRGKRAREVCLYILWKRMFQFCYLDPEKICIL